MSGIAVQQLNISSAGKQKQQGGTSHAQHTSQQKQQDPVHSQQPLQGQQQQQQPLLQRQSQQQQQQQQQLASVVHGCKQTATQQAQQAAAGQPDAQHKQSLLDRYLAATHELTKAPLLPTPCNVSRLYLSRDRLLDLIAVQAWVASALKTQVPLLHGTFVLVACQPDWTLVMSAQHLSAHADTQRAAKQVPAQAGKHTSAQQAHVHADKPRSAQLQDRSHPSTAAPAATTPGKTAPIPWRLCQVLSVEVSSGVDPADATVLLVGGDRVRAGAVCWYALEEVQGHEYLCCELLYLPPQHQHHHQHQQQQQQQQQQRRRQQQQQQLTVGCLANVAWRLGVASQIERCIEEQRQKLTKLHSQRAQPQQAVQIMAETVQSVQNKLKQLPPQQWVHKVLQQIELIPGTMQEQQQQQQQQQSASSSPKPLSVKQYSQLLQNAAAAWDCYLQQKLAPQQQQQLRPVSDFVGWLPARSSKAASSSSSKPRPAAPSRARSPQLARSIAQLELGSAAAAVAAALAAVKAAAVQPEGSPQLPQQPERATSHKQQQQDLPSTQQQQEQQQGQQRRHAPKQQPARSGRCKAAPSSKAVQNNAKASQPKPTSSHPVFPSDSKDKGSRDSKNRCGDGRARHRSRSRSHDRSAGQEPKTQAATSCKRRGKSSSEQGPKQLASLDGSRARGKADKSSQRRGGRISSRSSKSRSRSSSRGHTGRQRHRSRSRGERDKGGNAADRGSPSTADGQGRSKSRSRSRSRGRRSRSRSRRNRCSSRSSRSSSHSRSRDQHRRARSRDRYRSHSRVCQYSRSRSGSRGRQYSRSRSRGRQYSRSCSRDRSRSRSRGGSLFMPRPRLPAGGYPAPRFVDGNQMLLQEFADNLTHAARRIGHPLLRYRIFMDCVPPPLGNMVARNGSLTVLKLINDHLLNFQVVTKQGGADFVEQLLRPREPVPTCKFWLPGLMRGCKEGHKCKDRHDLPEEPRYMAW